MGSCSFYVEENNLYMHVRHDLFVILVIPIWMNAVKAGTLKSHGNILVCVFLNCNTLDSMFSFHRSEFMNLV